MKFPSKAVELQSGVCAWQVLNTLSGEMRKGADDESVLAISRGSTLSLTSRLMTVCGLDLLER